MPETRPCTDCVVHGWETRLT